MLGQHNWNSAIRTLTPADSAAVAAHLRRLERKARYLRFGGNVSDRFLASYASMPRGQHTSALGCFEGDVLIGFGQLTLHGHDLSDIAEAAMTVDQEWRDLGVGTALLARLSELAADASARRLRLLCVPLNLRLIHVARKFGADLKCLSGDLLVELPLPSRAQRDIAQGAGTVSRQS